LLGQDREVALVDWVAEILNVALSCLKSTYKASVDLCERLVSMELTQVLRLRVVLDICGQEVALLLQLAIDSHGLADVPGEAGNDLFFVE
jgi:hypothetical protein